MSAIIGENVSAALDRAINYGARVLEQIDAVHRLSRVVVVVALADMGAGAWRTMAEHAASPRSMTLAHGFGN